MTKHAECRASNSLRCLPRNGSAWSTSSWPQRYGLHWMAILVRVAEFRSTKARLTSTERTASSRSYSLFACMASATLTPSLLNIAISMEFWYSRCRSITSISSSAFTLTSKSCSARNSAWVP